MGSLDVPAMVLIALLMLNYLPREGTDMVCSYWSDK